MIIWLVGLSGSGKSTAGHEIYRLWKAIAPNTILLDGEDVREILGTNSNPYYYTIEGRFELGLRYAKICSWLDNQDINVICCTICNFEEIMEQNRRNYSKYFQVFLDAQIDFVKKRDPKGLYYRAEQGKEKNVMGIDIPYIPPKDSDYVIKINDLVPKPEVLAREILKAADILL